MDDDTMDKERNLQVEMIINASIIARFQFHPRYRSLL